MTFRESDFPGLLKFISSLAAPDADPVLVKERLVQLIGLYDRVPLYPGIAQMCAAQGVKEIDLKDAAPRQRLYVRRGGASFAGTVVSVEGARVHLESLSSCADAPPREVEASGKAMLIENALLETLWPSLSYPEKPQ